MPPALLGLIWAAMFAVPVSLIGRAPLPTRHRETEPPPAAAHAGPRSGRGPLRARPARPRRRVSWRGAAWLLAVEFTLLFIVDSLAFYFGRPMMTFGGLVPLVLVNLLLALIAALIFTRGRLNAGSVAAALAIVTFGTIWLVGHNSGHDAYLASHLVSVTVAPSDQLPASSTDHMVIVSPDIATTEASQAMASGIAGQRNYSTYLTLGPATLQSVDGRMWYVFPGVRRRRQQGPAARDRARLHHGVGRGPERGPGRAL